MMVTYDPEADAIYVAFEPRTTADVHRTVDLGHGRHADYNVNGTLLGIELLDVSHGIDLTDLPRAQDIHHALQTFPHPPLPV